MAILFVSKQAKQRLRAVNVDVYFKLADENAAKAQYLHETLAQTLAQRDQQRRKYEQAASQLKESEESARELFKQKLELIRRLQEMEAQLAIRARAARLIHPRAAARKNILAALSGTSPDAPIVRGLLGVIQHQTDTARLNVTLPNITNDARNFNAGRLASLEDLQGTVETLVLEAQKPAEKEE